jgi:hypothetical protein
MRQEPRSRRTAMPHSLRRRHTGTAPPSPQPRPPLALLLPRLALPLTVRRLRLPPHLL